MQPQLMQLGKKRAKYDSKTLQFTDYLTPSLPFAPQTCHWQNAPPLGMLMNDTLGNCTIAAALHMQRIWSKQNSIIYTPTDSDALAGYQAVGGYIPGRPETDGGCVMLDVLNYWRKTGLGGQKIIGFVQVNKANHRNVEHACYWFGGLYVGVQLPISAQAQTIKQLWDVPPGGLTGEGTPGSWGGHCIDMAGYTQLSLDTITWGMRIPMTWRFWDAYVDECWAPVSLDFFNNVAKAPNGFALNDMLSDIKLIAA